MIAHCGREQGHNDGIPDPGCSCGIYATTELEVVNVYLCREAPVLGIVELGGRTIEAAEGYRAQAARVAAILLIDEMFTLPHGTLKKLAESYRVPAFVPHSTEPEDYRAAIHQPGFRTADWDQLKKFLGED